MKKTYSDTLKDPRWQRKRLEVLQRANFACEACDDKESPLHVHHRYYVSGRLPWEYPDFCFMALCESCHQDKKENHSFEPWEEGLNHFGDAICDMMIDALLEKDFDAAHGIITQK